MMWIALGILAWCLISFPLGLITARFMKNDDPPS